MIDRSSDGVSSFATPVSAGTSGETPPRPSSPWHWAQANWTKSCAPAATCGSTAATAVGEAVAVGVAVFSLLPVPLAATPIRPPTPTRAAAASASSRR